jgi:hypothetical protein
MPGIIRRIYYKQSKPNVMTYYPTDGLDEQEPIITGSIAAAPVVNTYNAWFNSLSEEKKLHAIENETYFLELERKNLIQ